MHPESTPDMHRISPQIFRRTPSEPYNQMQMELISNTSIPEGLLASMTLLSEKPHQGVPSWESALHPGIDERNCTAVLGLRFGWSGIVSGTVVAPSNPSKGKTFLDRWPFNGNMLPLTPQPQDQLCTTGPLADPMNAEADIRSCCQAHDDCYAANGCNATSWIPNPLPWGVCNVCNMKVAACITGALLGH